MEQIKRIREMEEILRRGEETCRELDAALEAFASMQGELDRLGAYYGSRLWFFDLDCDRDGLLPRDLPRGVLSEDEAYDLLSEAQRLRDRMRELSAPQD